MNKIRIASAGLGLAALVGAPLAVVTATPANAVERSIRCAGADVDLDVERDDGRIDVDADIDDARPGSKWRVVLRQDGRVFVNQVRTADREGDISVDRTRPNTRGADTIRLTVKPVGAKKSCSTAITLR